MRIDGKALSQDVIQEIDTALDKLKKHKKTPKIAIVTVGPESAWMTYVRQKIRFAEKHNILHVLIHLEIADTDSIVQVVKQLNSDLSVTGIIVQRPAPQGIERSAAVEAIAPEKDIDGFRDDSHFKSPIWLAILHILEFIHTEEKISIPFNEWMSGKTWTLVGKGETGGRPTIIELKKLGIEPFVIDSKTKNSEELLKKADIVISGVGKRVVEGKNLKQGVILIGIGIRREDDGNLYGDYDENDVGEVASFYTPTPGGVGPLNLSYLYKNLVEAKQY